MKPAALRQRAVRFTPVALPTASTMSRCVSRSIGKPALHVARSGVAGGSRWGLSTKSTAGAATTRKMPKLTNRMRRLARAHPEAVAAISPSAVEESRSTYTAGASRSEVNGCLVDDL